VRNTVAAKQVKVKVKAKANVKAKSASGAPPLTLALPRGRIL